MGFKTLSRNYSVLLINLLVILIPTLFFLLPEERDNITSLRNSLVFNITLAGFLIILLITFLVSGKFTSIRLNVYDKIIIALFCWVLVNEMLNNPYFLVNGGHRLKDYFVLGSIYLALRFDRDRYVEQTCSKILFPALWGISILYGLIEICINMANANTMYFDLFFSNKGRAGLFILFTALINFSILKSAIVSKHKLNKITGLASAMAGLLLIIISNSRTAWLCLIVLSAGYLLFTTTINIRKITAGILITITLGIMAALSFGYKVDSSLGRGLILKVSLLNSSKYLLNGFGLDNFGAKYNDWQSNYFSSGSSDVSRDIYLADNTFTAFNDYLQFAVELGGIPVLLFAILLVYRLFHDRKTIDLSHKLFILAIALSSLTFYPLHQFHIQAILIIIIAFISNSNSKKVKVSPKMKIALLLPSLVLLKVSLVSFFTLKAISHWQNARADIEFDTENAAKEYRQACRYLNSEGQFLIEYAYFLSGIKKFSESIAITNQSIKFRVYQSTYLNLGHCFEQLGENDLSETYYQKAINCIPSRLGPRYKLILLYKKLNNREKMQREVLTALSLRLKNPHDQLSNELLLAIRGIYHSKLLQ